MAKRVVITGIGVISPLGIGIEPTFDGLVERKNGIRRITAFDVSQMQSHIGGEAPSYSMGDYFPKPYRRAIKVMARDIELAVISAYLTVRDAGLNTKCIVDRGEAAERNVDSARFGANIGAGLIGADLVELSSALASAVENADAAPDEREFSFAKWGTVGMNNLTPLWLLKFLPNMLACHVTIVHDCHGPSNTITCGEASSHLAVGEAFRTLARGAADICICGGAESKINPMAIVRQIMMGRLSENANETPEKACRPFDAGRSGSVVSEGGGLLILEELEHAKARGARIYAEVVGFGSSCNIDSWTQPQADGRAMQLAMKAAIKDAGVTADDIGLIMAQGVGTQIHDSAEAAAYHGVFGKRAAEIPVMSNKGALGNNGAGSGAIDLAVTAMSMHRGIVPPSQNCEQPDPACKLNVVTGDPHDRKADLAISSSFTLSGGQTAAVVLKRYTGS